MDQERRVLPLVRQATRLEEEAELALFFRREYPGLVRYAARLASPADAEDIVQDALLKFLAQRERDRRAIGAARRSIRGPGSPRRTRRFASW